MNKNDQETDISPEDIILDLALAEKIIKLAETLGASASEVFMIKGAEVNFSIEKDSVNFASSSTEFGMGIRVIKDKRLGFGYCTNLAQAENALKNAISSTKLAKQSDFEFVSKDTLLDLPSMFDMSIFDLSVNDGLEFTKLLINSCKELNKDILVTGGGIGFGGGSVAVVTSAGVEMQYSSTGIYSGISTLLKDKTISTGFEYEYSKLNDIDHVKIAKTAAKLALDGQNPTTVESGKYSVIFTPHALSELLESTVIPALYGEPANMGETVYSNRLGDEVANTEFSFYDDGTLENGINTAPIDDEGTPCRKTTLIEKGILKNYLFDRISALEFDHESTGNAIRAENIGSGRNYKATPKTKALNFTIEGKSKPYDGLISELDTGLIIHELLGAHTANSASGDFSVNSPFLFKVKRGTPLSAGKQVMIVGNMPELMNHILAIGDDLKNVSGGLSPIACRIPSVVFEDVKIV